MNRTGLSILLCAALAAGVFTGCAGTAGAAPSSSGAQAATMSTTSAQAGTAGATTTEATATVFAEGSVLDTSDLFTDRDSKQEADTSSAQGIVLKSGEDVSITEEGVYVISGTAEDCTITVDAGDSAKVQLVLDGASITNADSPAIYVKSADKVFVTTAAKSTNSLKVTGTFAAIGDDNVDGVIFSKDDIVMNGQGTLGIESSANGIVGKDDVKVTGGTYSITAAKHGIEGKDSVAISDGTFDIEASTDAIHSENADDPELGYIYISGGTFNLQAGSDGIGGTSAVQIDGGTFDISSAEGIEATYVQVNGGMMNIEASDDGINAAAKSTAYAVTLEINGGAVTIDMASGDTDALDANGNLYITGGTVDITAQSPFDYDGEGKLTGGTVTVNGEEVTELQNSMMGPGGGMGGPNGPANSGGGMGGPNGPANSGGPHGGRGGMR